MENRGTIKRNKGGERQNEFTSTNNRSVKCETIHQS